MSVEVIVKKAGKSLPALSAGELRYVVAANGLFLERRTALFTTSCRVESCPAGLEEQRENCLLHFDKIPPALVRAMLGFFRFAYQTHGGEAVLLLLYHSGDKKFSWFCPDQTVEVRESWSGQWYASTQIRYEDPLELPSGFVVLGDAHSHAEMPAMVSQTDLMDEEYKDGLHIIVGRVSSDMPDVHIDFVMDRRRFPVSPENLFAEPCTTHGGEVPRKWKNKILVEKIPYVPFYWSDR